MRPLAFCCAITVCLAGNPPAPDTPLIARIQARITENLAHLPDYTCTQTIERATRRSPHETWRTADQVRLEVGYVGERELFGYPGGEQLDEAEVSHLVPGGVIGSGDFAMLTRDIFANPGAKYTVIGVVTYGGRTAIRCDYSVPASASSYRLRVPPREAVVAYHGTFWVDENTLDLLRFDVTADRIPRALGLASSHIATEYQPVDSVVSFDNGPAPADRAPSAAPRQVLNVKLPRDFSAALTLQTPVDSAAAAIGDPVTFLLDRDLKRGNTILVPKRATFAGRIIRLEHSDGRFAVAFRLDTVEFGNFRGDLRSRRNVVSMNDHDRTEADGPPLAFASLPRENRGPGALITVLTDHLRWPKGFHFSLRSRMP
jgi:hypothetical protein